MPAIDVLAAPIVQPHGWSYYMAVKSTTLQSMESYMKTITAMLNRWTADTFVIFWGTQLSFDSWYMNTHKEWQNV